MMRFMVSLNKEKGIRTIYTMVFGFIGGAFFSLVHFPLPWVLGPMLFTVILTMSYKEAYIPPSFRLFGFFILGISLGLYFVPEMGSVILENFLFVAVMSVVTILLGLINGILYKKIFQLDWMTVLFGSIPGGLSQMVEIGGELGGKPEIIAIQQTLRIVLVVILIPSMMFFGSDFTPTSTNVGNTGSEAVFYDFPILLGLGITGMYVGKLLRIPIAFFTGPLFLISIISISGFSLMEVPKIILYLAQVMIGINIGTNFKRSDFSKYRKYLLLGLLSGISLTAISLVTASVLTIWGKIDWVTAVLSTAPGGIAEMSITAVAVGANVPLVAAFQVFRMILAVIIVPKIILVFSNRK